MTPSLDEKNTTSLRILLICNLPLGNIQISPSVRSTERLNPNLILFRLSPGTTTIFSADSTNSGIAFQVQDDRSSSNSSLIQPPEFLIWYPLPTIGGGAPQLLNNSPSGRDLLVYSTKVEKEAGDGGGDSSSRKLALGQSIAVTTTTAAAEIVVPIHSAEGRRWRLGYYVIAAQYPHETIAKLLGGGDGLTSPLWFPRDFESSGELPASGSEEEDVEMEEAGDERSSSHHGGSARTRQPARAKRRRRRAQVAEEGTDVIPRRRDAVGKAKKAAAAEVGSRGVEVDEAEEEEEEEEEPEAEETNDGDCSGNDEQADGSERSNSQPSPDSGLTSLSMTVPWVALAGGTRLKGQVDILPLNRPRPS
ncbi:uncharacterized protein PG986_014765 [Apiospora aurea]|uniref:Uncharacterized protein n=1 Tax=Apiospora aurea TaxID=335848 RepID=A0ABR1PTX6_9PEZI